MSLRSYPRQLLFITSIFCFVLLVLCGSLATILYREQERTAAVLSEDIGSRGAAFNLETTLNNLMSLHDNGIVDVSPLHDQVRENINEIERFANKELEQDLVERTRAGFNDYISLWQAKKPSKELTESIRNHVLKHAISLRKFNGQELIHSEEIHRYSLQRMVWGLAVIGLLGPIAGLVFGYNLARSLKRTIHQFLVRVQGATELLEQEVPTVEWHREGEPLQDGGVELLRRVEQVVQRLQKQEHDAKRSERLAAVGQLAAGVAHEIRNPLTSAILLIETGRKDPAAGGLNDDDLDLILQELYRIEESLQQFLDFARPPKLHRDQCDLREVIRDSIALSRGRLERADIKVKLEIPDQEFSLTADREQLRQVVLNLILNGIDAMPRGGTLTIRLKKMETGVFEIVVEDEGTGIAVEIIPRLFEPFATGKDTGLGLGLVLSKRIVEDHGGTIQGWNRPNGGAVFSVRIPSK